jgi:hypothetical protein
MYAWEGLVLMTPSEVSILIGMVTEQTRMIGVLDGKFGLFGERLERLETARAVDEDRAVRADKVAVASVAASERQSLALRWRVTIAISAAGSAATLILGIARFATGH